MAPPTLPSSKLVNQLKAISAKRRDNWKKSYQSFRPSQPESESIHATYHDRDDACKWIHNQCILHQLSADIIALAIAIFDRVIFGMKVKKAHVRVLATTCLLLAAKLLEDEQIRNLGKHLIRASKTAFSVRDLKRMEMTILSKINWEVSESTSVDFFSSLLDYIHVTTHNRKVVGLDAKKVLLHFLAKQLTNFETARIPPLELAFGLFMVAFKKYSMQFRVFFKLQQRQLGLKLDIKLAEEAARLLKPAYMTMLPTLLPPIRNQFIMAAESSEAAEGIQADSYIWKMFADRCLEPVKGPSLDQPSTSATPMCH